MLAICSLWACFYSSRGLRELLRHVDRLGSEVDRTLRAAYLIVPWRAGVGMPHQRMRLESFSHETSYIITISPPFVGNSGGCSCLGSRSSSYWLAASRSWLGGSQPSVTPRARGVKGRPAAVSSGPTRTWSR